jgi:hypothetical protein
VSSIFIVLVKKKSTFSKMKIQLCLLISALYLSLFAFASANDETVVRVRRQVQSLITVLQQNPALVQQLQQNPALLQALQSQLQQQQELQQQQQQVLSPYSLVGNIPLVSTQEDGNCAALRKQNKLFRQMLLSVAGEEHLSAEASSQDPRQLLLAATSNPAQVTQK